MTPTPPATAVKFNLSFAGLGPIPAPPDPCLTSEVDRAKPGPTRTIGRTVRRSWSEKGCNKMAQFSVSSK